MRGNMKHTAVAILLLILTVLALSYTPLRATEDMRTRQAMLTNVTTGNYAMTEPVMTQCRESAVYVIWGAATSAGAVTVESSYDDTYAGTWAPLAVVNWSAVSKQDVVQITGIHMSLRTRVSTTVVGGTVSTYFVCN